MSWAASIFIALLMGALGFVCAGVVGGASASWHRISSFEGASGYFVMLIALMGGVVGLVVGIVTARVVAARANPGFFKAFGWSCAVVIGIAGVGALISWRLADIPPTLSGQYLDLAVEIRLPAGETNSPASVTGESYLRLGSVANHRFRSAEMGELDIANARVENGRWIIPGSVFLFTTRGDRFIDAELGGKQVAGFIIPLPARPGRKYEEWSEWNPRPPPGSPPWPDTESSCRFRVVRRVPPPPPRDPAVVKAEEFAALKPDAPLPDWLSFLSHDPPAERVKAVMKVVEERPGELAKAIRSPDESVRELALGAVENLMNVTPEVSEAVLAEGQDIAAGIRRFNEMKADDEKFYEVQVGLRTRFSYWHRAWWRVHSQTGVDGGPPVQEILDLALVRARDTSMDEIVINARAHLDGLPSANRTP